MKPTRQDPLPGVGGTARIGRRAAASSKAPRAAEPGTLPLAFQTRVDPSDVLLHVSIPGEPRPKERPRMSAQLAGTGMVVNGQVKSGDVRIVRRVFTPKQTEVEEEALRWIFRSQRKSYDAVPYPVGVLALYKTTGSRIADVDNLYKLSSDAMNGTIVADDQQVREAHIHVVRRATRPSTDLLVYRAT